MNVFKKVDNKGFVATGILYSLIAIIAVIVFLITQNNFTTKSTISKDINSIKEKLTQYKIQYDSNDGTGSMNASYFITGETNNVRKNTFTKAGYAFSGWALSPLSEEVLIQDEGLINNYETEDANIIVIPITSGQELTLYAIWRPL